MNKLILGNLIHRPLRSVISAFAVAIEIVMILSVVAIFYGILNGSRTQQSGIGMDMMVRSGAGGVLSNLDSASADIRVANVLRTLPHVQVAAPVNIKLTIGSSVENIFGIDYATFNALRPFQFVAGGPFEGPNDAIIDDFEASRGKGTRVGDTIKILNHEFRVSGIFEHGKGSRKFIPIATMDEIDGTPGKAAMFYLRTDDAPNEDAKKAVQEQVRQEILATDGMSDYSVQTLAESLTLLTPEHIPAFTIALNVIISIAIIIGFLVIFQSMYTAVMERTREIGILKSMGASPLTIVSLVLRETGLLAVVGILFGVGFTYLLRYLLHAKFPTMSFQLTVPWVFKAIGIAMLGALCGALYPSLKAARKDPIDALSYE
jgi:putative ABC transport system permease protein